MDNWLWIELFCHMELLALHTNKHKKPLITFGSCLFLQLWLAEKPFCFRSYPCLMFLTHPNASPSHSSSWNKAQASPSPNWYSTNIAGLLQGNSISLLCLKISGSWGQMWHLAGSSVCEGGIACLVFIHVLKEMTHR